MIALLLAAATMAAPPAHPKIVVGVQPSQAANCPVASAHLTSGMIDGATAKGFHSLDKEPAPQAYLTVARKIDGCDVPMVVPTGLTDRR